MYRHLLVPIDGTDLSVEVVGNAVALARSVEARITFVHAAPDAGDGCRCAGGAGAPELLAKAGAAARAWGVPCESVHAVTERPAAAIVDAARERGCDLIFMASHGRRGQPGTPIESATLDVLKTAGLPVLVSSTGELQPPARAIAIIRDEHRSLAAVLHAWLQALECAQPDAAPMRAMLRYLQTFSVALHHPKEDDCLFRKLRQRTSAYDVELDELQRQHRRERAHVDALAPLLEALAAAPTAAAAAEARRALAAAVQAYASFLWEHMGREEGVILPAAQRHLNAGDWAEIEAAFTDHRDRRAGADAEREHRQLFARIVGVAAG